jgi:hypothetical protein
VRDRVGAGVGKGEVMSYWVGFDVGKKSAHWVCVLDGEANMILSKRVEATESTA